MMTIEQFLFERNRQPSFRNGRSLTYRCPFPWHDDNRPSFHVTSGTPGEKGEELWKCFGCDLGGTVIELASQFEGLPHSECYKIVGELPSSPVVQKEDPPKRKEKELASPIQRRLLSLMADWWHEQLFSKAAQHAREYLLNRGVSNSTQISPVIGYAPRDYDGKLVEHIIAMIRDDLGFSGLSEAERIGILKIGDDRKFFLPIQNRVTFSCLDPTDMTPVYYQARAVESDKYQAKYKIIGPRLTKFPFWMRPESPVIQATIAAEGPFGPASLFSHDIAGFATLGEGIDVKFLHLLLQHLPKVVFCGQDNDIPVKVKGKEDPVQAGEQQARKCIKLCQGLGIEGYRLEPPRFSEKENSIDDWLVRGGIGEILQKISPQISCNELHLSGIL